MSARRQPLPADIWVLVSAAFIVAIGYGIIAPILPQFAASFDLGVTEATIKAHLTSVFRKLGVQNRTQAVILSQQIDLM